MKFALLFLIVCFPFFVFSQVVDTVGVARQVDSLLETTKILNTIKRNERALPLLLQAADISKRTWGEYNNRYALSLYRLATVYRILGQYDNAGSAYLDLIKVRAKILGKDHPDYATSLNDLAVLYFTTGEYAKAEPLLLETKDIRAKAFGKDHSEYAMSLHNLATLYYAQGEYDKAEPLYLQSKDIRAKTLGKEHHDYGQSLNNLAALYSDKEDFNKAEILFLEFKYILLKTKGPTHSDYALCLNNLADLYYRKGDNSKSEAMYLESIKVFAKSLGKKRPDYAAPLHGLADLYMSEGNYAKAEPLYVEVKDIYLNSLGKEHPDYAMSLTSLACLFREKGDFDTAEKLFLESIEVKNKGTGKEHPDYATALRGLAELYILKGDLYNAEKLLIESKKIYENALGKDHHLYASSLTNLARLSTAKGDFSNAESLFLESLTIVAKTLGKTHPQYDASLYDLAEFYFERSNYQKAAQTFSELSKTNQSLITKALHHLSERELNIYLNTLLVREGQTLSLAQLTGGRKLVSTCFDNTLFHKGFLLEAVNARSNLTQSDTTAARLDNLQKSYLRRLAREYMKPIAERDSTHVAEWEEKANIMEKELMRTVTGYGDLVRQVSWQEVQAKLQPGEAAVEFIAYRYYTPKPTDSIMYAALVLLPTDTTPHFIPLFEEKQLQTLLTEPDPEILVKDLYVNRPQLRHLFWQSLETLLRNVKTVYYAPAGLLHNINPAALLDESKQRISANRQWVRLGSTRELVIGRLADQSFASAAAAPRTALVYGGITYDMDSLAFTKINPIAAADTTGYLQPKDGNFHVMAAEQVIPTPSKSRRGAGDAGWSPLVNSGIEVDAIAASLRRAGFRTDIQKGLSASEERFKKVGLSSPSPRILHLATHGFAYPDPKKDLSNGLGNTEPTYKLMDDPMLRSGLVLAGANFYWKNKHPLANHEDGVLVAYEVRDLNLRNTELAVLSACQTGLGDVVGSEGVYGLQRAFRVAGAKFLIVSLWEVPDMQTQELMGLFYQNWLEKKESLRDAFTHAQQTLQNKGYNPYLWAGFVLIE